MTELFHRHGARHEGHVHMIEGKPHAMVLKVCHRCGGAGGADKWNHTGWTCFECGGRGNLGHKAVKLFGAEKLAKLNEIAAKKAAKKAAVAAEAAAKAAAEAEARRAEFTATHGALIEKAKAFAARSEFIADVVRKGEEKAALTEAQAAALATTIAKIEASDAKRAASGHVGKVGERLTLTVTAERVTSIETQFGTLRIATMRDAHGNAIVAKGKFVPPTATFKRNAEDWDGGKWEVTAEPFTIKATVKEHGSFRDEKQTIVNRVAEVAAA
jgi:hypothetical protein